MKFYQPIINQLRFDLDYDNIKGKIIPLNCQLMVDLNVGKEDGSP